MQISIVLPVFSETNSVIETVNKVITFVPPDYLKEIIIVISPKSTTESIAICNELARKHLFISCFMQNNNPGIGWAFREAFQKAQGSHVLMMASDGETDPAAIPLMIKTAQETDCDIVTSNRWTKGGGFEGYSPLKKMLNYIFQGIIGIMYTNKISDYTYAYRLYKIEALKGHVWKETRHPFLLESLLRPLKKGATVEQIPVMWYCRTEGESKNPFLQNFVYFRTAIEVYLGHQSKGK